MRENVLLTADADTPIYDTPRLITRQDNIQKLSIIIPCYNKAATITTVLDKVSEVKLINGIEKEIILINDCSTDDTDLIIRNYIGQQMLSNMNNIVTSFSQTGVSFVQNIWNNGPNRRYLLWALGLCIVQFIIFKVCYPYPDFFSDSYSYIFAAYAHLNVSIWPIGYSKFLSFFHHFTYSDTALVGFQYFFMQAAALYFFFSIHYFFTIRKWTKILLFIFLFVNPLTLYLCNTVNSDALFGALSLLWFTELVWIIHRPKIYQVFLQAILLFLCFTVRNNAYYYPIIAVLAFLLSQQNLRSKLLGIILPFLLIIPFILHTRNEAYKLTGTRQFSLFTGWQLANNALYFYDQVSVDSTTLPTQETRQLNQMSIDFFKHIQPEGYHSQLESFGGNFFLRYPQSPLKQYLARNYPLHDDWEGVKSWGKASVIYESFGKSLILQHPLAYLQYFVLPNIWHYFMPPLLHLAQYNYGSNKIDPIAKVWFHYPTNTVHCISPDLQQFLIIYTALFFIFNLYFLWQSIRYFRKLRTFSLKDTIHSSYWIATIFIICNFVFSISVTVNIIRYQYIPMYILLSFWCIITDFLNYNIAPSNQHSIEKKQQLSLGREL